MGITSAVTLAAVLAGAVAIIVLVRMSTKRLDGRSVIWAFVAMAVAGAVALVWLDTTWLDTFGVIHLAYLGLVVSIPMLGAAILLRSARRPHSRPALAVGGLLLVPMAVGLYATHVAPFHLEVEQVRVPVDAARTGHGRVRIAVLSDIQMTNVGPFERQVVDRIMEAKPDVILVSGDLFQSEGPQYRRWLPEVRQLLGGLRATGGVYVVQGDVDEQTRYHEVFAANPDARVLDNEVVTVKVGDRVLRIGGTKLAYDSPAADGVRSDLQADPGDGSIRILVSHRPDTVLRLPPSSRVDLTVAGHTHGGQVVVPGFGPIMTLTRVPRDVAAGGLHEVNGNRIYVSPGVGEERGQAPQLRLFDPPTIGVLDLEG